MQKQLQIPRVSLVYDRRKVASESNPASVEIEIYFDRDRMRLSTGIKLYPSQWRRETVVNHHQSRKLNSLLERQLNTVNAKIKELCMEGDFSLKKLKGFSLTKEEKNASDVGLFDWIEERIKERPLRDTTRKQHMVMLNNLRQSGIFSDFEDITVPNIMRWDNYLHANDKGIHGKTTQTTVHGYHKRFKTYVNEAVLFGLLDKSPYNLIKIARGRSETIKYLTDEEKARIEKLKLHGACDVVRDLFVFSCYTGLSFSDMIKINKADIRLEDGQYLIEDKRQKTDSHYKIILLPKALEVLKKYDYNLNRMTNQKCNEWLKIIASGANIDKNLTFHMARHTFATWALRSGVRIEVVSKMLAHADIKTTQNYARVLQEDVNAGFIILSQRQQLNVEKAQPVNKKRGRPKKNIL